MAPDEILAGVRFPLWSGRFGFGVEEFARRHGDFAIAGAAVAVELDDDDRVRRSGIGLLGLSATPRRASAAEAAIAGRKVGDVTAVFPKENRVLVSGINMIARHTKPSQGSPQGGIIRKEAPIHVSNVAHLDPKDNKPVRVGYKMIKDTKVRFARRSGEVID